MYLVPDSKTNMMLGDADEKRAPQVCSHCKSIKKGCDKKLPSCSQCIKRGATCRYGEPVSRSGSRRPSDGSPARDGNTMSNWTSMSPSVLSTLNPNIRVTALLVDSLSDTVQSSVLDGTQLSDPAFINRVFHSQVCHIIRADGQYIDNISSRYFHGIHRWLPIISRRRFLDRLMDFQSLPTADFSMLLLSMHLITKYPSTDHQGIQDQEVLYLTSKTLLTQVRSFIPSSLYLVQAGIIIASYEHAHGRMEAAYDSIGASARMAFALGLHRIRCSEELQGTDEWLQDEERLATWWGLVVCDRIVGCEVETGGRPLATRYIRKDDYIPLESEELEEIVQYMAHPTFRYFVSATALPSIGSFGRQAQAAYLFDRVLLVTDADVLDEARWAELSYLDQALQELLGMVMEQVAGRLEVYCGATALAITALYTLHRKVVIQPETGRHGHSPAISRIALNTITRMVIDIAHAFNAQSKDFDIEILSPFISHVVRAAQQHIMMAGGNRTEAWHRDFDELRRFLGFFNQRWLIAGKELGALERTIDPSFHIF